VQRSKASHLRHIGRVPSPLHSFGGSLFFETHMQVDAFLKEHEIFDYSVRISNRTVTLFGSFE
jgi:hypothetical protein